MNQHSAARITPSRALWLGLGALTLFRLWAAAVIPLTEDEAYYRLWSISPQLGYYDHPPMIAWWIALGRHVLGDTPLGVRVIGVLAGLATSLMVFDLTQTLGGSKAMAERAALWCNATLLIGIGGVLAVPDSASVPFWMLTLCCLARTRGASSSPGWWAAAGAAAGLACLSKYSALFLAPGVVLWLVIAPGGLAQLRRPWPWLAALIAAAVFSPNIAWNAQHHWLTFAKQFGRVAPGQFKPGYLVELVVGQALLLNPVITAFLVRALGPKRAVQTVDLRLPLAAAAPFAAYLVLHALHDRVQAHWPVPLYPALALCAAVAADPAAWSQGVPPLWVSLRRIAAPLGLGLSALVLLHLALPITDLKGARDPSSAVRGWPTYAAAIEADRVQAHAGWIGTLSYGTAGQLADQAQITAPIVQVVERQRYPAGDASWRADLSRPGLIIDLQRRIDPARLRLCFAQVTQIGSLVRGSSPGADNRYAAVVVAGPRLDVLAKGCPGPN